MEPDTRKSEASVRLTLKVEGVVGDGSEEFSL